ncbi:MAG: lipoyl protein ligase domain-containing protein, partial [Acidimicrobiales bacterium]
MSNWVIETVEGPATLLHRGSEAFLNPGGDSPWSRPRLRVLQARPDAVVLGSFQPSEHLDARRVAAAGLEVVRRRSGGAAVLVGPAHGLWVDLLVPSTSTAWRADVSHAAWWVGERWAEALGVAGVAGVESGAGVENGAGVESGAGVAT